jgi:hypothetical protein
MKKLIITCFVFLFLALSSSVQAQDNGIRAGWHYAGLFADGTQLFDPLNSFYVGFFRNNQLGIDILSIHTGLEYFQNGNTIGDEKLVLHYVSIPVALRVKLGPVFALGGLGLNFKLGGNTSFHEEVNFFDLPALLGVGVKLAFLTIEARYGWGLLNIADGDIKNQYFQLGLGISLER